ncbi:MAG: hypothetical protein WD066_19845 [Planctomycetaceae bacterium]
MTRRHVVVETAEEFERLADDQTVVVSFESKAEEAAYERLDNGLDAAGKSRATLESHDRAARGRITASRERDGRSCDFHNT